MSACESEYDTVPCRTKSLSFTNNKVKVSIVTIIIPENIPFLKTIKESNIFGKKDR